MAPLFVTRDFRTGMDFLMFNEGIEEIDNQIMEWKSLGVIMRAIFVSWKINLAYFSPHIGENVLRI